MSRPSRENNQEVTENPDTTELVYVSVEAKRVRICPEWDAEVSEGGGLDGQGKYKVAAIQGPPGFGGIRRRYCNKQSEPSSTLHTLLPACSTWSSTSSLPPLPRFWESPRNDNSSPVQDSQGKANLSGKLTAKQKCQLSSSATPPPSHLPWMS